jgi:hypothetical protein
MPELRLCGMLAAALPNLLVIQWVVLQRAHTLKVIVLP